MSQHPPAPVGKSAVAQHDDFRLGGRQGREELACPLVSKKDPTHGEVAEHGIVPNARGEELDFQGSHVDSDEFQVGENLPLLQYPAYGPDEVLGLPLGCPLLRLQGEKKVSIAVGG